MRVKMGKLNVMRSRILAMALALVMTVMYGTTAFANGSPDNGYETDSSNILVSEADTSIPDIYDLMMGEEPAKVLGDSALTGYSTLAVFSVTAIDDYDFSDIETTKIKGAAITADMDVQVRFLPTGGAWEKIECSVDNGVLLAKFPSEGQFAVFVKDDIDIDDGDQTPGDSNTADPGKAPQTGDALTIYIGIGVIALGALALSYKKIRK